MPNDNSADFKHDKTIVIAAKVSFYVSLFLMLLIAAFFYLMMGPSGLVHMLYVSPFFLFCMHYFGNHAFLSYSLTNKELIINRGARAISRLDYNNIKSVDVKSTFSWLVNKFTFGESPKGVIVYLTNGNKLKLLPMKKNISMKLITTLNTRIKNVKRSLETTS